MIGVKMNTFNETSSEPEQDANSALTELDKGLRSGKVGEQCEAIVRFPRLFEKYPFPILINSSFLKLADVFRMGNNFLRLWVLRVCQQSEKHLDKILNIDEFLRRVFSVLHSNDPVARALALRTLGAVAGIIPERQNVHHAIRRGLDSHDNVEVDAAIYATTRFAAHSNAFAVAMSNKLSDMVESEGTAADRRAKLVRALRTVHGGAIRAEGVLKLLKSLLEKYPSSSLVRSAIIAITHIAADTVVHVPDQVELLLDISVSDPRSSVRRCALSGLRVLARHAALWPPAGLERLAAAARHETREHVMMCLRVMQRLVQCGAVLAGAGGGGGAASLRQYCSEAAFSTDLQRAATAAHVLTAITVHCYEEDIPIDGSDLMLALETLVIATGADDDPKNLKPLKMALQCLVRVSSADKTGVSGTRAARCVCAGAARAAWRSAPARARHLLEAMCALPPSRHPAGPLLHMQREGCISCPPDDGTSLVLAATIIFQERAARALSHSLRPAWATLLLAAVAPADGWTRYRMARAALRYGHHSVAAQLLRALSAQASTEPARQWLAACHEAADADAQLVAEGISALCSVSGRWECAAGAGWGGAGGGGAGGWAGARAAGLGAAARAAAGAAALCSQPPPAVAQAQARQARPPAAAAALRRAAQALHTAAQRYASLARHSFHADDSTLRHYYIGQYTYELFAQFLDRITSPTQEKQEMSLKEPIAKSLEERIALAPSQAIARIADKLFDNPTTNPGITHRHAEAVRACVGALCTGAVWARGWWGGASAPALRVSLWPHDSPAALPLSHRLALRLEGVLLPPQLISKRQKPRQVKGVQITVNAIPHPRTNEKTVELTNIPPVMTAVQTVTPVRDFFSAQQLVSVPSAGLYTVTVDAALLDNDSELWNTGLKTSIVVKAHEESTAKGNTQTTRGRF